MAFAKATYKLPTLRSYEHCVTLADTRRKVLTTRHRNSRNNWSEDKLPLVNSKGRWSKQGDMRMEWREDGEDSRWALMLFRTEVVGYFRDGRVLLNASYNTVSTRGFFYEVAPEGVWVLPTDEGYAYCIGHAMNKWHPKPDEDVEYHAVNRGISVFTKWNQALIIDEQGVVLNPQPWTVTKTVANMSRRREIRAKLAPFIEWFNAMTKVGNSMKGVVAGVETFEDVPRNSWGGRCATTRSDAVIDMLDQQIVGDGASETQWREACWTELVRCFGNWHWERADAHDIGRAKPVLQQILNQAFKTYDGYKNVKVTVPAGQRHTAASTRKAVRDSGQTS